MRPRRFLLWAAAATLAQGAVAVRAQDTAVPAGFQELYAAAKKEGRLSLYGGGPASLYSGWAREFEERFPGIRVDLTAGFSNLLAPRIDAQLRAGKLEVDLAIFQTLQDFDRWKRAGALTVWKPEGFEQIPDTFKDPEGMHVGIAVYGLAYAYNTEHVRRDDVPRSALDFLDPKWNGRITSTYPHDDDVTLYLYDTIVRKYGWEFMDRLMAAKPAFVRGHLGVAQRIAAGTQDVTFDTMVGLTMADKARGRPTDFAIPEQDPMPIWPQTAAVFNGAPHPNAARLYLAWFLAKEQQARLGTWSPRADVPPPAGLKPIFQYNVANSYREFVLDEARLRELRKRFEAHIGPVKGEPTIGK